MKVRLTNTTTNVTICGQCDELPTQGFEFYLQLSYTDVQFNTSKVIELWKKSSEIWEFKTTDSSYKIVFFSDLETMSLCVDRQ